MPLCEATNGWAYKRWGKKQEQDTYFEAAVRSLLSFVFTDRSSLKVAALIVKGYWAIRSNDSIIIKEGKETAFSQNWLNSLQVPYYIYSKVKQKFFKCNYFEEVISKLGVNNYENP